MINNSLLLRTAGNHPLIQVRERSPWVRDFPDVPRSCLNASGIPDWWKAGICVREIATGVGSALQQRENQAARHGAFGHAEAGAAAPLGRIYEHAATTMRHQTHHCERSRQRARAADGSRRRADPGDCRVCNWCRLISKRCCSAERRGNLRRCRDGSDCLLPGPLGKGPPRMTGGHVRFWHKRTCAEQRSMSLSGA